MSTTILYPNTATFQETFPGTSRKVKSRRYLTGFNGSGVTNRQFTRLRKQRPSQTMFQKKGVLMCSARIWIPYVWGLLLLLGAGFGCSSTGGEKAERGKEGTIAYKVQVESSEPGARVEANGDYVGNTPLTLKVFGDKDGTFHNFGTDDYVIRVFPVKQGQHTQTRVFRTGRWFSQEDRIPSRLFFDLNQKSEGFSIDLPTPKSNQ